MFRQWHSKHVSLSTNTPTTIEDLWEVVFSVWPALMLYDEDHQDKLGSCESAVAVGSWS
jgi:hypothetical protein